MRLQILYSRYKLSYVFVCSVPDGEVLYFAREEKGHEGVKGTVTEDYQRIIVHDYDRNLL